MTINIALIDDHTLFRSGIKALLSRQTEFSIVGEASDGFSGVKLVEQIRPDVVLLDLNMPQMNGRDALAQILSSRPEQKVIMLTVSEDSEDLTECIRLGASGFLLKNINANYLIESIKKVVNGDNAYSPEMTARLVQSLIRPAQAESALSQLTPRELEHQLNDSGASTIIVLENFANTLELVLPRTQIKNIILASVGEMFGAIKGTLMNFVLRHVKKAVPSYQLAGTTSFQAAQTC